IRVDEGTQSLDGQVRPAPKTAGVEDQRLPVKAARSSRTREEIRSISRRHFAARNLPMRFVAVDFEPGGRGVTIFFSSDEKVDFRELHRDLCRDLRMRVTMHRLGPRDEAKRAGTCGPCGRTLCCKSFLPGFPTVSVKLVKEQKFPLTPDRSAGMCGRLKCCLAYETGDGAPSRTKCGGCRLATSGAGDAPGEPRIPAS